MNNKTEKKIRKLHRKQIVNFGKNLYNEIGWKLAHQRDIIFLIAIIEFIGIIILIIKDIK
jgi:type IV secretory pathway component VirB8